jgi:hypothetical protein
MKAVVIGVMPREETRGRAIVIAQRPAASRDRHKLVDLGVLRELRFGKENCPVSG